MITTVTTTTVTVVTTFSAASLALVAILTLLTGLVSKEIISVGVHKPAIQRLGKALNVIIMPLLIVFILSALAQVLKVFG